MSLSQVSRTTAAALCAALCTALMASGCASSSITAMGGSSLTQVPLPTSGIAWPPWIYELPGNGGAVVWAPSETEIRVDKYSRAATLEWSTPIQVNAPGFSLVGNISDWDQPIALFQRGGRLILYSIRTGDHDSLFATGRLFDAATGKLLLTKTLDSVPDEPFMDRDRKPYVLYGFDTNNIVLAVLRYDHRRNIYTERIVRISNDLATTTSSMIDMDEHDETRQIAAWFDARGTLYTIQRRAPDTLRLLNYDFRTGTPMRSALLLLSDSAHEDAHIVTVEPDLASGGDVILLMSVMDGHDVLGMATARIDTARMAATPPAFHLLSEETLERLFDDDEYSDGIMKDMLESDDPKAHYIAAFETFDYKLHKGRYAMYEMGDILLMAFDSDGNPSWQQSIRKSSGWFETSPDLISMKASISEKGTARVLYRDGSGLNLAEFRLDNGEPVPGSPRLIIDMGRRALSQNLCPMWPDDTTLMLLLRQGVISQDWSIGILHGITP